MSPAIPSGSPPEPSDSGLTGQVESVEINVAPGLQLTGHRRQIVAAILDLMQGKVTKQKMDPRFWCEDVVFENNVNKAVGLGEVEAQWVRIRSLLSFCSVGENYCG